MCEFGLIIVSLPLADQSVKFALAYYAYALGHPEESLSHLNSIPNIVDVQSHIPGGGSVRSMASTTLTVPGRSETPSSTSGASLNAFDTNPAPPDVSDGRAWSVTEIFRSICLQGMFHNFFLAPHFIDQPPSGMATERLYPSEPRKALDIYTTALPILASLTTEAARPTPSTSATPSGPGKLEFTAFTRYREPWRWAERLLWRAIILASQKRTYPSADAGSDDDLLWRLFTQYRACLWPPTFRTEHRATISVLQIRAHILRSKDEGGVQVGGAPIPQPSWAPVVRQVIQEYQAILTASTTFPRAGERNVKVEEFVDLCVAVWEACGAIGEHAGWVIDVRRLLSCPCRRTLMTIARSYGGPLGIHSTRTGSTGIWRASYTPRATRNSQYVFKSCTFKSSAKRTRQPTLLDLMLPLMRETTLGLAFRKLIPTQTGYALA